MLTVVIPSYNHEHYIRDCLAAACKIKVQYLKILVIDDGSTDGTVEVVNNFMAANKSVSIEMIEKPNSGLVSSLNLALSFVKTEFIYICASDDIPVPAGIEACISFMAKEKKYNFIIGGAKKFSDETDESDVYGAEQNAFLNLPPSKRHRKSFFNYPSPLLIQSSVFRTQSIKNIGGWDSELILDDYPFFVEILRNYPVIGSDFYYLPEVFSVKYRQHPNNSYRNTLRQFKMVDQVIRKLAPDGYKNKAVSNCAARYILSALKNRRFNDCYSIFRIINFKVAILLPFYIGFHALQKSMKLSRLVSKSFLE